MTSVCLSLFPHLQLSVLDPELRGHLESSGTADSAADSPEAVMGRLGASGKGSWDLFPRD